jgi:hypothetical protein
VKTDDPDELLKLLGLFTLLALMFGGSAFVLVLAVIAISGGWHVLNGLSEDLVTPILGCYRLFIGFASSATLGFGEDCQDGRNRRDRPNE